MTHSIGSFAREQISNNPQASNQEILDLVKVQFPEARTSIACIAWYKSNMKKTGYKAQQSAPPERTLEVIQANIEEVEMSLELLREELEIKKEEQAEFIKAQYEYYKNLVEQVEQ
jgi:vacuolar-type H+-ATPase subunit I/STV1